MKTKSSIIGAVAIATGWMLLDTSAGLSGVAEQRGSSPILGSVARLVEEPYKGIPPPQDPGWYISTTQAYAVDQFRLVITNDGGRHWRRLSFPPDLNHRNPEVYGVRFASRKRGWLLTSAGLWCSDDGGITWRQWEIGGRLPAFADSASGWMRVDRPEGYTFYKTSDGGAAWKECGHVRGADTRPVPLWVSFVSPNEAASIGVQDLDPGHRYDVELTRDGGCEWERLWSPGPSFDDDLNSIYFLDSGEGWLGGNGPIYNSADGGRHWHQISSIRGTKIISLCFSSKWRGWLLSTNYGRSGGLFSTEDGGRTWTPFRQSSKDYPPLPSEWNRGKLAEMLYTAATRDGPPRRRK